MIDDNKSTIAVKPILTEDCSITDKRVILEDREPKPMVRKPFNLLFEGYDSLTIKNDSSTILPHGCEPMARPLAEYLNKGFIALDKPSNPSSHEVSSWVKRILGVEKTGHAGTLDPKVTGTLLVLLGKGTRLSAVLSGQSKEYVCAMRYKPLNTNEGAPVSSFMGLSNSEKHGKVTEALQYFTGKLYQKPPVQSAVKRKLRIRTVYESELLDFDYERGIVLFRTECEAGTYIRTLVFHIGLYLGLPCEMVELRRTRSGWFSEGARPDAKCYNTEKQEYFKRTFSLHDLLDAKNANEKGIYFPLKDLNYFIRRTLKNKKEPLDMERPGSILKERELEEFQKADFGCENYIRTVVRPIEALLMKFRRIFVNDNAVGALSCGAKLAVPGIVRYDMSIEVGETVVVASLKGEAIYLGKALMNGRSIEAAKHGLVVKPDVVFMEDNKYPREWGKNKEKKKDEKEIVNDKVA